jgi:hypothetical protein
MAYKFNEWNRTAGTSLALSVPFLCIARFTFILQKDTGALTL